MLYKVKLTQIGNLPVTISNIVCIPERLNNENEYLSPVLFKYYKITISPVLIS